MQNQTRAGLDTVAIMQNRATNDTYRCTVTNGICQLTVPAGYYDPSHTISHAPDTIRLTYMLALARS